MSMVEVIVAAKVLSKLLQAGMAAWDAFQEKGIGSKEVTAIRLATDLLGELGGKGSVQFADMAALHLGVITQCFGHALGRQWAFNRQLAPRGLRLFMGREQRERAEEIDLRVKLAVSSLPKSGGASLRQAGDHPASVEEIKAAGVMDEPLATPYYRALWKAFTNPKLDEGDEERVPLLDLENGRLGFERDFLLAYQQALAAPEGQKLQKYMSEVAGDHRARLLRELLMRDMAGWGERHTFGNLERHDRPDDDPVRFMPLAKMYVEPSACLAGKARQNDDEPQERALSLVRHWLGVSKKNVVVVRADFGMGKSLTARMLGLQLARKFLEMRDPSPEVELPVFIRCAEDLTDEAFDFNAVIRRAWKREAEELGLGLNLNDPALALPERMQRALFILDGLDEVILGEQRLESFFQRIKDEASEQHRFIIFSRPGALPAEQKLSGIPVLDILPWTQPQIAAWLEAWRDLNGAGPSLQELEARGLGELTRTPILLFMIAQTWRGQAQEVSASRAALYEEFFWQIARGKHEADRKLHKNVFEASAELHRHLMRRGLVEQGTEAPEAMLWLMGRVAWEATKLDQRGMIEPSRKAEVLTKHDITNLLVRELEVAGSASATTEAIQVGLLLTLQAHLRSETASQLLFGHKSFREFLVARYWADRLKTIARGSPRSWEDIEAPLLGGRLLSREDRTFEFLMEMLDGEPHAKRPTAPFGLTGPERRSLLGWAQARFESEEPEVSAEPFRGARGLPSLRDDRRPWLREAALAIGSTLRDSVGLRQRDKLTLRSMLAWFWLMRVGPIIIARKADLSGALMPDHTLRGADFREANLRGANFSRTNLRWGGLNSGLPPTNFAAASLDRALLMNADLSGCNFEGASLRGADLTNSALTGGLFHEADLEEAELHGTSAIRASFNNANLRKAVLMDADLTGALFVDADMTEAALGGADFTGAVLDGARLHGAAYDDTTRWPHGFDPIKAGAVHSHE